MLDERIEFELYNRHLFEFEDVEDNGKKETIITSRLNNEITLKKNYAGIVRVLTILARGWLEEKGYYDKHNDSDSRSEIRKTIVEKLDRWCFEQSDTDKNLYDYFEAVKEYYKKEIENGKGSREAKKKRIMKAEAFVNEKRKLWMTDNTYSVMDYKNPSRYAINFPIIVADAINAGPLKRRAMICSKLFYKDILLNKSVLSYKNDFAESCFVCDSYSQNSEGKIIGGIETETYKNLNRRLKLIAACLVKKADGSSDDYVYINKADAANWMDYPSYCLGNHIGHQMFFSKEGEKYSVFENPSDATGALIRLNKEFVDIYKFRLIDLKPGEKEQKKQIEMLINEGYICFVEDREGAKTELKSCPDIPAFSADIEEEERKEAVLGIITRENEDSKNDIYLNKDISLFIDNCLVYDRQLDEDIENEKVIIGDGRNDYDSRELFFRMMTAILSEGNRLYRSLYTKGEDKEGTSLSERQVFEIFYPQLVAGGKTFTGSNKGLKYVTKVDISSIQKIMSDLYGSRELAEIKCSYTVISDDKDSSSEQKDILNYDYKCSITLDEYYYNTMSYNYKWTVTIDKDFIDKYRIGIYAAKKFNNLQRNYKGRDGINSIPYKNIESDYSLKTSED